MKIIPSICRLLFGLILLGGSASWVMGAEADWKPQSTWVFAVGILEWQHPDQWPTMEKAKLQRRDAEIVQHFRAAGVPASQIVALTDHDATLDRIQRSLTQLLAKTRPHDLLIVYYAGHGFRDRKSHLVHFANYDSTDGKSAWSVKSIVDSIEQHFHGDRAVLIADSCFSGGLMDEVLHRTPRVHYACLCSSFSHNTSTGAWTYTDTILKALRGDAALDANADGLIELTELAEYAQLEMGFIERQRAVFHAADEFPRTWKIAVAKPRHHRRVGERLEVLWHEKWYRAQILDVDAHRVKVHYVKFADQWDEWVESERTRKFEPSQWAAETKVEIRDRKVEKWYPGHIRRSWYGIYFVHYDEYLTEWDEWVTPDRVRLRM